MNFNSLAFFIFLGFVLVLHYSLPWRIGRWMLVAASYIFYGMANPWYCLLLLTSTLVDFWVAQWVPRVSTQRARKRLLLASVLTNLTLLGVFKYGDFSIRNLNVVLGWFVVQPLPLLNLILPVGISFYTFQTLSYTIDVYRGKMEPTKNFAAFALYVAYFPQLVAGPIERAHSLLPQLSEKHRATMADLEDGFQRILWGLVKKVVVADRLALVVNDVYFAPEKFGSPVMLLVVFAFYFQLYLDFSAYTDIAIGVARLMGIRLSENFHWPYLSRNVAELWSRWHMTLTNWFRDYVYVSMGGTKRERPVRSLASLCLVFTLVGVWHGADWNFFFFGLVAGLSMAGYQGLRLYLPRKKRGHLLGNHWWSAPLGIMTVCIITLVAMTFFRAPDARTAWVILSGIFTHPWVFPTDFYLPTALVMILWGIHFYRGIFMSDRQKVEMAPPVRALFWLFLISLLIFFAVEDTEQFIYFQF